MVLVACLILVQISIQHNDARQEVRVYNGDLKHFIFCERPAESECWRYRAGAFTVNRVQEKTGLFQLL